MDFIFDTQGRSELLLQDRLVESDDDVAIEDIGIDPSKISQKKSTKGKSRSQNVTESLLKMSAKDIDLDDFEREMGWTNKRGRQPKKATSTEKITKILNPVDKLLEKSVVKPGFEQLEAVPPYEESRRRQRKLSKIEREKTKGKNWFNLPATEMTEEIKNDLEIIQMRSALDPKHFYKKNDIKALPKYFQIGKVVDTPINYYNSRLTKKERKRTIVDELMADAEFSKFNKRKYKEIVDEKRKMHYKAHRHARKLKGKNK